MIQFSLIFLCIVVLLVLYCPVQSSENEVTTINDELIEDMIKGIQHGGNMSEKKRNKNSIALRVVRGFSSGRKSHPHLAYIGFNDSVRYLKCGGSIISREFILTAAHCVSNQTTGDIYADDKAVFLGVHDRFNMTNAKTYKIMQVIVHENYFNDFEFEGFLHHDIALLKVSPEITYNTFIQPICVTDNDMWALNSSTIGIIHGWGQVSTINETLPQYPMKTNLTIQSGPECDKYMWPNLPRLDSVVCGIDNERAAEQVSGVCMGDSGSPFFIITDKGPALQIGIASWLQECAVYQKTNVFTRVTYFLPWIFSHVPRSTVCVRHFNSTV